MRPRRSPAAAVQGLQWHHMDMRMLDFPSEHFNVIIDKAATVRKPPLPLPPPEAHTPSSCSSL